MLKEKWNKMKTLVEEHRTEILIGAVVVIGGILVYVNCKNSNKVKMNNNSNSNEDSYMKAYNKAAEIANETLIPEINKKYEQYDFSNVDNDPIMKKIFDQYMNEYEQRFNEILESQL